MPRTDLIQLRRGTAAEWAAANPILDDSEPGAELDTYQEKIGDGVTHWLDLPYVGGGGGGGGGGTVESVNDVTPDGAGNVQLDAADVGAEPTGTAAAAVAGHVAASDPHPQYQTSSEVNVSTAAAITAHTNAPDPHPQYLTAAEGDGRYDDAGDAAAAIATHVAESDPHPQYLTQPEGDALYEPIGGGGGGLSGVFELRNFVPAAGAAQDIPDPSEGVTDNLLILSAPDCVITLPSGFDATKTTSITIGVRQADTGGTYDRTISFDPDGPDIELVGGTLVTPATGASASTEYIAITRDGGDNWKVVSTEVDLGAHVVVQLTDAATITPDASLGDIFDLTMNVAGASRVMNTPVNSYDGQALLFRLRQDPTGGRTIDWDDDYEGGTDVTEPVLSTAGGALDYVMVINDTVEAKFHFVATPRGY